MPTIKPSRGMVVLVLVVVALGASTVRTIAQERDDEPKRSSVRAVRALLAEIDRTELCFWQRHGRYSDSIADLQLNASKFKGAGLPGSSIMSRATEGRLHVEIDAGETGRSYIQRITGQGIDTYFERRGTEFADYADLAWGHVKERCEP
jgi:hypothetical protein